MSCVLNLYPEDPLGEWLGSKLPLIWGCESVATEKLPIHMQSMYWFLWELASSGIMHEMRHETYR